MHVFILEMMILFGLKLYFSDPSFLTSTHLYSIYAFDFILYNILVAVITFGEGSPFFLLTRLLEWVSYQS